MAICLVHRNSSQGGYRGTKKGHEEKLSTNGSNCKTAALALGEKQ
jgi:hypothetical protein